MIYDHWRKIGNDGNKKKFDLYLFIHIGKSSVTIKDSEQSSAKNVLTTYVFPIFLYARYISVFLNYYQNDIYIEKLPLQLDEKSLPEITPEVDDRGNIPGRKVVNRREKKNQSNIIVKPIRFLLRQKLKKNKILLHVTCTRLYIRACGCVTSTYFMHRYVPSTAVYREGTRTVYRPWYTTVRYKNLNSIGLDNSEYRNARRPETRVHLYHIRVYVK